MRDEPCLVPATRVAVCCPAELFGAAAEPSFTGTSSHVDVERAILHATVEICKRDAFLVAWYRRRRLRALDWPADPSRAVMARLAYLEQRGICLELYDLGFERTLPMVLVRARATEDRGNWPAGGVILTPAGGLSGHEALEHALKLVCGRFVSLGLERSPARDVLDPAAVARLSETAPFWPLLARYLNPAHAAVTDFLGGRRAPFSSLPAAVAGPPRACIEQLRERFRAAGLDWISVGLTDAVARQCGFEVVKVLMPQLARLTMERDPGELSRPRFARPIADATSPPEALNPDPHPLY